MVRWIVGVLTSAVVAASAAGVASAQVPQPFPRPAAPDTPRRDTPATPASQPPAALPSAGAPTEATLGFPIHPTAQFIASYDAGRGQRYYIFGATAPYAELVTFYKTQLRERGDEIFEQPPTHMFEVGRFRNETMAFPPGVTIKDWTWSGSAGYPNPVPGAEPSRFPSVIMFVPAPPAAAAER